MPTVSEALLARNRQSSPTRRRAQRMATKQPTQRRFNLITSAAAAEEGEGSRLSQKPSQYNCLSHHKTRAPYHSRQQLSQTSTKETFVDESQQSLQDEHPIKKDSADLQKNCASKLDQAKASADGGSKGAADGYIYLCAFSDGSTQLLTEEQLRTITQQQQQQETAALSDEEPAALKQHVAKQDRNSYKDANLDRYADRHANLDRLSYAGMNAAFHRPPWQVAQQQRTMAAMLNRNPAAAADDDDNVEDKLRQRMDRGNQMTQGPFGATDKKLCSAKGPQQQQQAPSTYTTPPQKKNIPQENRPYAYPLPPTSLERRIPGGYYPLDARYPKCEVSTPYGAPSFSPYNGDFRTAAFSDDQQAYYTPDQHFLFHPRQQAAQMTQAQMAPNNVIDPSATQLRAKDLLLAAAADGIDHHIQQGSETQCVLRAQKGLATVDQPQESRDGGMTGAFRNWFDRLGPRHTAKYSTFLGCLSALH